MNLALDRVDYDVEDIHNLALCGQPRQIDAVLERMPTLQRSRNSPLAMLQAMRYVQDGNTASAIKLLRCAVSRNPEPVRSYMVDLLVPLLITSGKYDEAESALARGIGSAPGLVSLFIALRAVLAAVRGHKALSWKLADEATSHSYESMRDVTRARVLSRCSLAAYYRGDFTDASERAIEAARLLESLAAFRHAAIAYSVPCSIAHNLLGDPSMVQFYARRIVVNGRRAGDASWVNYGLVAQLDLAVESADMEELGLIRRKLMARPLHEQYAERFSTVIASALMEGWEGRFDIAQLALGALRDAGGISLARRSLCTALMALCEAANWNVETARRFARPVLSHTGGNTGHVQLSEVRLRRIARTVAAATCLIIGDTTRGRRALSRDVDPTGVWMRVMTAQGVDESRVPALLRGYARFIDVAAKTAAANRPAAGLTTTELRVLRALSDGSKLMEVAAELDKSPETVKKQTHSIYVKLGARNRVQAIRRAHELQLL